jgi:hypothetical protein
MTCQCYTYIVVREDKGTCYLCKKVCPICGRVIETWIEDK